MSNYDIYLNEQTPNTQKVIRWANKRLAKINYEFDELLNVNKNQLEEVITKTIPNSKKSITTLCYVFGAYNRWLYDNGLSDNLNLYNVCQSISKEDMWFKVKDNAPKKYISYDTYKEVVHDIDMYEKHNTLYYSTLFQCIYEGIWNEDMSFLLNLRGSDVNNNIITLRNNNGYEYQIEVSSELASKIKELSLVDKWDRNARWGVIQINIMGKYSDSVFKVETRCNSSNKPDAYKDAYYAKIRKIVNEYVEYNVSPQRLFISGIMYRIREQLKEYDMSLQYAFTQQYKSADILNVIRAELKRSNYNISVDNFTQSISGHIEMFE